MKIVSILSFNEVGSLEDLQVSNMTSLKRILLTFENRLKRARDTSFKIIAVNQVRDDE